jgi:[acyl-carrier-protein] S-malonyltransferase
MAAILGLQADEVAKVCADAAQGEVVSVAGLNGGGQVVIAGDKSAVSRAKALAAERGARSVVALPVSAPFHCALMAPAAQGLQRVLGSVDIRAFSTGVISNVDAELNLDAGRVKNLLIEQVVRPVRWEESVQRIETLGCQGALEIGPGKVLRGLMKRISSSLEVRNLEEPKDLEKILSEGIAA